jgi:hypothetical protein
MLGFLDREKIEHGRHKWFNAISWFPPVGALCELFSKEWVERGLALMESSWIICQAAALSENSKYVCG